MARVIEHSYILATIVLTVYSQLVMRWQVKDAGPMPSGGWETGIYVINLLLKPWVITAIISTFAAGVSWMLAMTKFEIGYAYPFVSLVYVFVLFGSVFLFNEPATLNKVAGTAVILVGLTILVRG